MREKVLDEYKAQSKRCSMKGCRRKACLDAYDNVASEIVRGLCEDHAWEVVKRADPVYQVLCPHCGNAFGVE